ncbi:MAG: MerR family transcriptional regulator [Bacteroidales bacterium]|nr:MerR family transcriptional regulator [Bacteroidales bacterium]
MEKEEMPTQVYSIKDLEEISGIKAHTLRIWEKRYNILSPERTNTNIRYYSDSDLKKLLNISILCSYGYKISQIAWFSEEEMREKILKQTKTELESSAIESLIISMVDFDIDGFEEKMTELENKLGFEKMITELIYPFFTKVGVLWQTGVINPAQEHFVSNIIKKKFFSAIDKLVEPKKYKKTYILFLPENEQHELGLLFAYYLLKKNAHKVIYLGQSVPIEDLIRTKKVIEASGLFTSLTTNTDDKRFLSFIEKLKASYKTTPIFLFGSIPSNHLSKLASNMKYFRDYSEFIEMLKKM